MRRAKSNSKVGDIWKGIDKNGRIGIIKLAERNNTMEVWRWTSEWPDGSGLKFDWATSYAKCRKEIDVGGRFKKIKKGGEDERKI